MKSTSSQWLILFRKIRPSKLTQQTLLTIDAIKKCLPSGKSKDFSKVSTCNQSRADSPG